MPTVRNGTVGIHCRVTGSPDESACLLIHGLNTNIAFWHPALVSGLGECRLLLMYDQRGHGYSDMPPSGYTSAELAGDALAVMDSRGVECADVVAHSFGATVALQLARLHPGRVRSLAVLDGRVRLLQPEMKLGKWRHFAEWERHFSAAGVHVDPDWELDVMLPLRIEGADLSTVRLKLAETGLFVPASGKRSAAKYRALMTETSARADLRQDAGLDLESLRRFDRPMLAVYGDLSPFLPTLDGLRRSIPSCRVEILPGAGHNFPFLRPRETVEAIRRFWREQRA